ncbi:MAG: branched-chain amino acid ABC transporter permease [Candidatus Bathyarchaeia archaeon]
MHPLIIITLMGVCIGSVYGLLGLGLSLIFIGVRNTMNVAHGHIALLAAFTSFFVAQMLRVDPLSSLIIVGPFIFFFGFLIQYGAFNKLIHREPPGRIPLILGVSLIIENTLLILFGPDPKSLGAYAQYATLYLEALNLPAGYLISFIISLALMLLTYILMTRTYIGIAIRATSEDHLCVQIFGVNYKKIFATTFALGSLLSGVGGVLLGTLFSFDPSFGSSYLNTAFSVLVIGGASLRGCFIGGVILSLIYTFSAHFIGIAYSYFLGCVITLTMLFIRPEGIFGYKL